MERDRPKLEIYAKHRGSRDVTLLALVLALLAFGLVMLFSTSAYNGLVRFQDSGYYLKKQLFATSIGLAVMAAVSRIDYRVWRRFASAAYLCALALSGLVLAVAPEQADEAVRILNASGEEALILGEVAEGDEGVVLR